LSELVVRLWDRIRRLAARRGVVVEWVHASPAGSVVEAELDRVRRLRDAGN
jgi:hypothetical protein